MADIFLGDETQNPRKRKRIRRLADEPGEGHKRLRRDKQKKPISKVEICSRRLFIICLLISLTITILLGNYYAVPYENRADLFSNLINNYQNHYRQILHGRQSYCEEHLDATELASAIRKEEIFHQKRAMQEMQSALHYDRQLISIAVVGPVGVGKNLYANALQKHWPWPENIHTIVWNTYVRNESEKIRNLRILMERLSTCGTNLLIIRNLTPADKHLMEVVSDVILEHIKMPHKRLVVIYIYNLNTMLNEREYQTQFDSLQNIPNIKTVNFKSFGRQELEDCIRQEMKMENMTLSDKTFLELLDTIDVKRSGCKNVNAKVLAFGRKSITKSKDLN